MKKARLGIDAQKDIERAVSYYAEQSLSAAQLFIEEYKAAISAIERMSGAGSLRFAHELDIRIFAPIHYKAFPTLSFTSSAHVTLM